MCVKCERILCACGCCIGAGGLCRSNTGHSKKRLASTGLTPLKVCVNSKDEAFTFWGWGAHPGAHHPSSRFFLLATSFKPCAYCRTVHRVDIFAIAQLYCYLGVCYNCKASDMADRHSMLIFSSLILGPVIRQFTRLCVQGAAKNFRGLLYFAAPRTAGVDQYSGLFL